MSVSEASLKLVQDYVRAIENRDHAVIESSLADEALQIFPMAGGGWEGIGSIYQGRDEVLAYTFGLLGKFDTLVWINKDWTVSADGSRVFMEARSDGVATHSGKAYHNTYATRFDVKDGKITEIREYAIAELFIALGAEPVEADKRANQRTQDLGPKAQL